MQPLWLRFWLREKFMQPIVHKKFRSTIPFTYASGISRLPAFPAHTTVNGQKLQKAAKTGQNRTKHDSPFGKNNGVYLFCSTIALNDKA